MSLNKEYDDSHLIDFKATLPSPFDIDVGFRDYRQAYAFGYNYSCFSHDEDGITELRKLSYLASWLMMIDTKVPINELLDWLCEVWTDATDSDKKCLTKCHADWLREFYTHKEERNGR